MINRQVIAVIDTNVLLSALWNRNGSPARVVEMILRGELLPCISYEIMREYRQVLSRDKFRFAKEDVDGLLAHIEGNARIIAVTPSNIRFSDESDRKFYDAAKACDAVLITGDARHYPKESFIMTVKDFVGEVEI